MVKLRWLIPIALLVAVGCDAQTYSTDANLDDSTRYLSTCVLPTCDPGGSGPPTAVSSTVVSTTPCGTPTNGLATEYYVAGNPYVNALWVYKTGAMIGATHFKMSFRVCFDKSIATAQAFEADAANFVAGTPGTNYMFGGQCDFSIGLYDVWDQANPRWIPTKVPCLAASFADGRWHRFERELHTDVGKALWFDSLTIDGKAYPETVLGRYQAGPLPTGWGSTKVWQVQLDIGPSGQALTMWVDQLTGVAWQ